jgi:large conductance mechanosensitive channel protein
MAEKKKSGFVGEFKEFISRGSVIDLAVGVIIGGAFSQIVNSLVGDIVTPLLSIFTGNIQFKDLAWSIPFSDATIKYGLFIQNIISFLLIALVIFLLIKGINVFRRRQKEEPAEPEPAAPSKEEQLLAEIRDLLLKKQ